MSRVDTPLTWAQKYYAQEFVCRSDINRPIVTSGIITNDINPEVAMAHIDSILEDTDVLRSKYNQDGKHQTLGTSPRVAGKFFVQNREEALLLSRRLTSHFARKRMNPFTGDTAKVHLVASPDLGTYVSAVLSHHVVDLQGRDLLLRRLITSLEGQNLEKLPSFAAAAFEDYSRLSNRQAGQNQKFWTAQSMRVSPWLTGVQKSDIQPRRLIHLDAKFGSIKGGDLGISAIQMIIGAAGNAICHFLGSKSVAAHIALDGRDPDHSNVVGLFSRPFLIELHEGNDSLHVGELAGASIFAALKHKRTSNLAAAPLLSVSSPQPRLTISIRWEQTWKQVSIWKDDHIDLNETVDGIHVSILQGKTGVSVKIIAASEIISESSLTQIMNNLRSGLT